MSKPVLRIDLPVAPARTTTRRWLLAACGLSLGVSLCSQAALAQEQGSAAPQAASDEPAAIVVTAQRRNEDIKDVPLSVSVLSGDELVKRGISNFEDIARMTPGVAIYNTGGSNLSRIFIRGVSSTQGTATVAVYLDDVSLTTPNLFFTGATLPRFFDMNHVETLRGPQGTLFGASALGGALRFIPNKPDLKDVGGSVRGDVSTTDHAKGANYLLEAVLNVPVITDKLAVRVGMQTGKQAGFVDRIDASGVVQRAVNEERQTAVRASLLYKPGDTLSIEPALLWQKTAADGTGIFNLDRPGFQQVKRVAEPNSDELFIPSLTVRARLAGLDVTSVGSYLRRTNLRLFDSLSSPAQWAATADPARGTLYGVIANLAAPTTNNVYVDQWSQEVRISTPSIDESGNRYELQVGGYFANQKVRTDDFERITGLTQAIRTIRGVDPSVLLGAPVVEDKYASYVYTSTRREFALFAEGSYELLDGLKLTVGGRQSFTKVNYQMIQSGPATIGSPAVTNRASTQQPLTPKFAMTYEASREISIYGNISKGYRLGGENNPLPSSCAASLIEFGTTAQGSYKADSLWSYEGGAKMRLFGNRLTVNASGYYIDWNNIQQSVSLPSCGFVTTVNAGAARSFGGELEVSARLTRTLSVGGTASLVDAKISQAAPGSGTANGQWLLHIPRHSYTAYVDFEPELTSSLTGLAHIDANLQGSSFGSFAVTNPDYRRPAYTVVNANIGARIGEVEVTLYAQNLLNQGDIIQRPSVFGVRQGLIVRPRTIGLNGRFRF